MDANTGKQRASCPPPVRKSVEARRAQREPRLKRQRYRSIGGGRGARLFLRLEIMVYEIDARVLCINKNTGGPTLRLAVSFELYVKFIPTILKNIYKI